MDIYLIAGKAGSGKKEVAKIIKDYYEESGKKVLETNFSKYLKLYAKDIINWSEEEEKPRKFMQELGVTIRENMDMPNMLVNRMIEDLKVYSLYFDVVVINDVKLPNEIEEIRNNFQNVYSMYIINQFSKSNLSLEEQMDITETALEDYDDFDITITNDNLNALDDKVVRFLESE